MTFSMTAGGVELPSPVSISIDDEIIWSADAGRDLSGLFSGNVVSTKKTIDISWGVLTANEVALIRQRLTAGYFVFTLTDGISTININSYRGTLSAVMGGWMNGEIWYKSASVKIVQR